MFGLAPCRSLAAATLMTLAVSAWGCAATTTPPSELARARAILAEARAQPLTDPALLAEATGALEYAELELRISPTHPLSDERAKVAVEKARAARASQVAPSPPPQGTRLTAR